MTPVFVALTGADVLAGLTPGIDQDDVDLIGVALGGDLHRLPPFIATANLVSTESHDS